MRKYSQYDPRWATDKIGKTRLTLGRYGCLISSICMIWSRFYRNHFFPSEAAKVWNFTRDGLLKWDSFFHGMLFCGRYNGPPDHDTLHQWVRSHERGMVVQLDGYHWAVVYYYPLSIGVNGIVIIDPLGKKVRPLRLSKYKKVTGYALFEKVAENE